MDLFYDMFPPCLDSTDPKTGASYYKGKVRTNIVLFLKHEVPVTVKFMEVDCPYIWHCGKWRTVGHVVFLGDEEVNRGVTCQCQYALYYRIILRSWNAVFSSHLSPYILKETNKNGVFLAPCHRDLVDLPQEPQTMSSASSTWPK